VAQNTFVDELVTDDIPGGDIDEETEVHTLHAEEPPTLRPAPPPPPTSSRSRDPQPENQSNKRRSVLELVRSVFRRG